MNTDDIAIDLVKLINTELCPYCGGNPEGIISVEYIPEGSQVCECCKCVWYPTDLLDYMITAHLMLDRMKW